MEEEREFTDEEIQEALNELVEGGYMVYTLDEHGEKVYHLTKKGMQE